MVANQTVYTKLEQRSVIKVLEAEEFEPWKIFWRISGVYGELCFGQKNV